MLIESVQSLQKKQYYVSSYDHSCYVCSNLSPKKKLAHNPKTQIDVHSNVHRSYNVHTRICIHKPRARLGIYQPRSSPSSFSRDRAFRTCYDSNPLSPFLFVLVLPLAPDAHQCDCCRRVQNTKTEF